MRLEPRCTARRGEEPDGTPSPKETRRGEGCPAETEAARQATGRGDRAGAVGTARAHLAASARSCPSPLSVDKRTLLQKGGNLSNDNNRQRDLPPVLPSSLPASASPCSLPARPGPPRAPSASRPAERCRQFRIQSFSIRLVLFFIERGGEIQVAGNPAHTHTHTRPPTPTRADALCLLTALPQARENSAALSPQPRPAASSFSDSGVFIYLRSRRRFR